jgi:putative peptidoglycan lipid II flippase
VTDRGLMRSSAVMASGTLVSRVLGFVRAIMLTSLLGVNAALAQDTFTTANTVPNQIYNLIAGGLLNAVLVPQLVRATKHADGGREFLDRLLTLSVGGLLLVTAVVTVAAPLVPVVLGPATGPPWSQQTAALAVAFALWCLPQVFFYGLYTVLGQVLNARGHYGAYMWAPAVNNVVAIAGLAVMLFWIGPYRSAKEAASTGLPANLHDPSVWTSGQIALLAGSATLGVALQALVLLVPLRRMGFRYRPRFGWRGVGLGTAGRIAGWTFASALVGQLGYIVTVKAVNSAGTQGGPGQGAYSNAFLLFMLPHSLITVSLVTALFTRMSQAAADKDLRALRSDLSLGLRLTGVATVLATAGMLALAPDLTRTLFFGNDADATRAMAYATMAMIAGLVPFSAQYLFQRAFYSLEDARTPFLVQLPVVAVIAVTSYLASVLLSPQHVVIGVALGMAAGYTVGATGSAVLLRRRIGHLDGTRVVRSYVRLVCAAVPAALAAWAVSGASHRVLGDSWSAGAVSLLLGGSLLVVVFVAACRLLRVNELGEVAAPVLARLRRR